MERIETDLCVIGAGSGGLSVAAGAVQMGARVVLVEAGEMGGDCLNAGCVPSKALLAAGKAAQAMRTAGAFGIRPVEPEIDFAAVKDHVARTIAAIAPHDSQERFEGLGVRVLRDWGRFVSPTELRVGARTVVARRFVIATGSRPLLPPIPGLDRVKALTNETIFALRERPEHLIVIGGGPVGIEMAQAHRRLGCRVTVIAGEKALPKDDPELAAVLLDRLRAEGVEIVEGVRAEAVQPLGQGLEVTAGDRRIAGSHLLVAAGRKPALDALDPAAAGVEVTEKGVKVGPDLRSSNRRIYAVGDAAGGPQFTHLAGYHASVVIRSILFGLPSKATALIPHVTYTEPELAQIGLTEAQAREIHGDRLEVLRVAVAGSDRAQAEAATEGLVKLMVARGRPVGVSIAAPHAGEMIGLWAMALASGAKLSTVAGLVLPYPTLNELSKRAAGAYFSPKLFDSRVVRTAVRTLQRLLP
ncbi:Pyruvate/2-oxoglutarate dehydrogenase complex, dihydrolipoamide dehydrogenase (E3) component [[Luteovulum] sphaeroides subsp. megalophilum]|uniref:dihydrolipoyl dehydrogenase family protein n=1 Tax=Cereibacter sphaeroides TaxID=1063 RepID=UPI000B654347|nr:FAD-dependent oxidoreductase [Cereibacter sphaeroides]SNS62744.1 Pyruvate/2-oxoglutarate dehydrogenase complex, dihydrolipoamide dehydrogenase (E3) component [[Luteovulum] sphaeroides subsp. megalophilum]